MDTDAHGWGKNGKRESGRRKRGRLAVNHSGTEARRSMDKRDEEFLTANYAKDAKKECEPRTTRMGRGKLQAPTSKLQRIVKFQTSILKVHGDADWRWRVGE